MRANSAGGEPAAFHIREPVDRPYGQPLTLHVDVSDRWRGILRVRERIPIAGAGELILLYPKWLPGFHAPVAPIELLAGLHFEADGRSLTWRRHPTMIHAFAVSVPDGVEAIAAEFQFLSPTDPAQGPVISSPELLLLPWNAAILYPAGHAAPDWRAFLLNAVHDTREGRCSVV